MAQHEQPTGKEVSKASEDVIKELKRLLETFTGVRADGESAMIGKRDRTAALLKTHSSV